MADYKSFLVSVVGPDAPGKIAAITGCLFEGGANLCDSAFNILGAGFEFSAIVEFGYDLAETDVNDMLTADADLENTHIRVLPLPFKGVDGNAQTVTHKIQFLGGDRPGLVARMSEVIANYRANIITMNSKRLVTSDGFDYQTCFEIDASAADVESLTAAVHNTAGSLRLQCQIERI